MEGCKTLTEEAKSVIANADLLIGAGRMLEPFSDLKKEQFISWKSEEIADFLREKNFDTAAILMSGDCGFYSGAEKLITALSLSLFNRSFKTSAIKLFVSFNRSYKRNFLHCLFLLKNKKALAGYEISESSRC